MFFSLKVVKNLVYLSKVLHRLDLTGKLRVSHREEVVGDSQKKPLPLVGGRAEAYDWLVQGVHSDDSDQEEGGGRGVEEGEGQGGAEGSERSVKDLTWLMRRMSRLASQEAGQNPKESIKVRREGHGGRGSYRRLIFAFPLSPIAYSHLAMDSRCESGSWTLIPPSVPPLPSSSPPQGAI